MDLELKRGDAEHLASINVNKTGFAGTIDGSAVEGSLTASVPGAVAFRVNGRSVQAHVARTDSGYLVWIAGRVLRFDAPADEEASVGGIGGGGDGTITPPMPGNVVKILVEVGQQVAAGTAVVIVESMKMQNAIDAPFDAVVESVNAKAGDLVQPGQAILVLKPLHEDGEAQAK